MSKKIKSHLNSNLWLAYDATSAVRRHELRILPKTLNIYIFIYCIRFLVNSTVQYYFVERLNKTRQPVLKIKVNVTAWIHAFSLFHCLSHSQGRFQSDNTDQEELKLIMIGTNYHLLTSGVTKMVILNRIHGYTLE